ncbi:MAG: hypothetical protein IKL29_07925 [Bacteroidaceae bacterium]|nr:hypothetical protein [Bacteroidaceae bacterium]
MKQYILTVMMSLILFAGPTFANGHTPQVKEKSKAEKFIQQLAKVKSSEIDYAYISASMFKQMFSIADIITDVVSQSADNSQISITTNPFGSIRSFRKFASTGRAGYVILKKHIAPFLQEDDNVMDMALMALNRESGTLTAIYSGSGNILVVSDNNNEISILFIVGLDYETFKVINESGIDF